MRPDLVADREGPQRRAIGRVEAPDDTVRGPGDDDVQTGSDRGGVA
jgi:hypothetical protein